VLFGCSTTFAQTNIISFTNASGVFITNATAIKIAENKLLYRISAGGGIVKLDSLPPDIRAKFNYNPDKAAAADKQEQQAKLAEKQAEADRQKYLESLRGPVVEVEVKSCNAYGLAVLTEHAKTLNVLISQQYDDDGNVKNGYLQRHIKSGVVIPKQVYLLPIPQSVKDFYAQKAQLENEIAAINQPITVTASTPYAGQTETVYFGGGAYAEVPIDPMAASQEAAADELNRRVEIRNEKLRDLKNALQQLESKGITVTAYSTGLMYDGIPLWQPVTN